MASTDPESRHHPGGSLRVGLDFEGTESVERGLQLHSRLQLHPQVAIALLIVVVAIAPSGCNCTLNSSGCNCTLRLQLHSYNQGIYLCQYICCEAWTEGTQPALGPLTSVRARFSP